MARDPARPSEEFAGMGLVSAEDHAEFVARHSARLAEDVAAARSAGARVYLISCEHLHSRLPKKPDVARVRELVAPHFDAVEVHCFLRPQVEMAISRASTGSRVGLKIDSRFFDAVTPKAPYYDYQSLLWRWGEVFGREHVTVVPFARQPSPVAHFSALLGLSAEALPRAPRRVNGSLDFRAVALMNDIVRAQEALGDGPQVPPVYRTLLHEDLTVERRLSLGRAMAEAVQARFAAQNRAVVAAWPAIEAADLEPDWDRWPDIGTFELLESADYAPVLRELVGRFNQRLAEQRGRIAGLESELAERDGRVAEAVAAQQTALAAQEEALTGPEEAPRLRNAARRARRRLARLQAVADPPAPEAAAGAPAAEGAADAAAGGGSAAPRRRGAGRLWPGLGRRRR